MLSPPQGSHWLDAEPVAGKPCYIHGIAYNNGMAYRVTDTLDPKIVDYQNDPNYLWDPAVRLTYEQMKQDMTGLPMLFEHNPDLRVGTILHNFLDKKKDLNIIAEVDQESNLGRWVARNVRAGLLQDLSIGYPTSVQHGTRKVQHKEKISEVSFVVGGFFKDCEVMVRASKNAGYKNTQQEQELTKQIRIVNVMASAQGQGEIPTQPPAEATESGKAEAPEATDTEVLIGVAEMKKLYLATLAENEALRKKTESQEEAEKKRREEYAISNQPKYEEAMKLVDELAARDGGEPVSNVYKEEMKYAALNPESRHMFEESVRVTASAHRLLKVNSELEKKIVEMQKANELTKAMLSDTALLRANPEREDRRASKVAARAAAMEPLDAVMVPDPDAPPVKFVPAWASMLGGTPTQAADQLWNRTPPAQAAPPPAQAAAVPPAAAAPPAQDAPPSLASEQASSTAVQVGASGAGRGPRRFKSSNPNIRFPVLQGMGGSSQHQDVWGFIQSRSGDGGFNTGQQFAGRNFGESH